MPGSGCDNAAPMASVAPESPFARIIASDPIVTGASGFCARTVDAAASIATMMTTSVGTHRRNNEDNIMLLTP